MKKHRKILLNAWSMLTKEEKQNWFTNLCYNNVTFVTLPEEYECVDDFIKSFTEEELDIIWLEVVKNV